MTRTIVGARQANEQAIGVLIEYNIGPPLFVDEGELYEQAMAGDFGPLGPITVITGRQWPVTEDDVNAERDRRLVLPFAFAGSMFQRDAVSVARINGAVSMAMAAMMAGTPADTALWVYGGPFQWIAEDNSVVQMTPGEVVQFGLACAAVESRLVFAARVLKDMETIPEDFTADEYWQ